MWEADIIIVGAGISGAVLAERYAQLGKQVLVLEKRDHIGGNCFDFFNQEGVQVSKYGAHLFHTNDEKVWEYVNRFSEWRPYKHKVLAWVDDKLVPVPVNIKTVNDLLGENISNQEEMQAWLKKNQVKPVHGGEPQNGEEAALARVGRDLYEKIFKNYTKKQWDKYPHEMDASVLNRIPVRDNYEDGYFSDKYQAQPVDGYAPLFEKMLDHPHIKVKLGVDFFKVKSKLKNFEKIFYTGPVDLYFNYLGGDQKLEYRSLRFESETLDQELFQENSVINYPNDHDFTRIVEYKHITGQEYPKTTIVREFSQADGEPYYPVPNPQNRALYEKYQHLAKEEEKKGIFFVGRLANYKYFNMDQAFKNALELFEYLEG
jgi:UDP-galactopyranose mutase